LPFIVFPLVYSGARKFAEMVPWGAVVFQESPRVRNGIEIADDALWFRIDQDRLDLGRFCQGKLNLFDNADALFLTFSLQQSIEIIGSEDFSEGINSPPVKQIRRVSIERDQRRKLAAHL